MNDYHEFKPSQNLVPAVECFWEFKAVDNCKHIVLPDGCTDFLLRFTHTLEALEVVGTMTRAKIIDITSGYSYFGIRFKPGMALSLLPIKNILLTNKIVPFASLDNRKAEKLVKCLSHSQSVEERVSIFNDALDIGYDIPNAQISINKLVNDHGQSTFEELYDIARIGERQFRRYCVERIGVPPKSLIKILRFKKIYQELHRNANQNLTMLAIECGYYDHAHMIQDFKKFTSLTPTSYISKFC